MPKSNKPQSQVIVMVAIITAISLLGDSMLYIALPIYWESVGLDSIWQVGILLSINRFIRLPINPIIGWLYHKISLKTGLIIAILLGSLTTLGYGVFNGFVAWLILRSIWGIAWSFFKIGGLSIVAYHADEKHRGRSIGLYNGISRLGSLVGMLAGGLLVPLIGLSTVSIIFGCLTLVGLPLTLIFMKSRLRDEEEKPNSLDEKRTVTQLLSKNHVLLIGTGFCVTLIFQGILMSTLSSVIEHDYGEQIQIFGTVISVTFLTGILLSARWLWEPFLGERLGYWSDGPKGRIPMLIISLLVSSLLFGVVSSNLPIIIFIIITLFVLIAATSLTTIVDAVAIDYSKNTKVIPFLTAYSIVQDLGASIGPVISFMFIGLGNGFSFIYWGGSVIFLLLAVLWLINYKPSGESSV